MYRLCAHKNERMKKYQSGKAVLKNISNDMKLEENEIRKYLK